MPAPEAAIDDFEYFDADNHYYEPHDAFTRHGDESIREFVRWEIAGKKRHLFFGQRQLTSIPNPTFNPIARPGAYHDRLKDLEAGGERRNLPVSDGRRYGELQPLPSSYQNRDVRLQVMDEQNLDKALLFPTLGVHVAGLFADDAPMTYKLYRAFNEWLEDDWGYAYKDRILAAPYIPMARPDLAVNELETVLSRGARLVVLRPGPASGRSPGDICWDPFWARLEEADVPAAYHVPGGPSEYDEAFSSLWLREGGTDAAYANNFRDAWIGDRAMLDTAIALVLGNVFGRFPRLRILSIEMGSAWVPYCIHALDHAGGFLSRHIEAFGQVISERPSDIFRRHFWISPFPEEDLAGLAELIGVDQILFGSDWPHPEGTPQPRDYVAYASGLGDEAVRKIMRGNAIAALGLTEPPLGP